MALSGTYDSAWTVAEVISEAYAVAHIGVDGEPLSSSDQTAGIRALQLMLRTWAADGVRLWLNQEQSVTLVDGTATYTLSPRALEVLKAYRRSSDQDVPVRIVTREEYTRFPNKTTEGAPFAVFIDRTATSTTATVYPVPGATEVAASMTLRLAIKRQLQDVTAASETLDWPPEWIETVVYNLATRIAPRNRVKIDPVVAAQAAEMYENLQGQDREQSVYLRPATRRG